MYISHNYYDSVMAIYYLLVKPLAIIAYIEALWASKSKVVDNYANDFAYILTSDIYFIERLF